MPDKCDIYHGRWQSVKTGDDDGGDTGNTEGHEGTALRSWDSWEETECTAGLDASVPGGLSKLSRVVVAAENDSRALAGSVRQVQQLINSVCFAHKQGEWNNGRHKDEQALESKQASRMSEEWPYVLVLEAPPEISPTLHILCFL